MHNKDAVEKMIDAYETMLKRVDDVADKTMPAFKQSLDKARETAIELGELTREEADKIAGYVERDMHDAAEFIVETGQDFKDWFSFDVQLIEAKFYDMFASIADQTSLELRELAERAKRASVRHTGEITAPGTLICSSCGEAIHFKKTGRIPPCPKCHATQFKRSAKA